MTAASRQPAIADTVSDEAAMSGRVSIEPPPARANGYETEVAALWRLLEAASHSIANNAGATLDGARNISLAEPLADTPAIEATAATLGGLVSDLTLTLDDDAIAGLMAPLSRTRFLSHDAALKLGLQTTPAALNFVAQSPSLNSGLVYHLIFEGFEVTQAAIARRADLLPEHIDALISRPGFVIAYQLVKNRKIRFKPAQIEALSRLSLKHTALRAPLITRPEFGEPEAMLLMGVVGFELKAALAKRFPNLDMTYPVAAGVSTTPRADTEHTEPAFLVHCLMRGHKATYARGLARRFDLNFDGLMQAFAGRSLVPLALTLAALGVDRAVFNSLMRQQAHGTSAGYARLARAIFALTPEQAIARLKANPDFFKATRGEFV